MDIFNVIGELKEAVRDNDLERQKKLQFTLTNNCRKNILNANKAVLQELYPEITDILSIFYESGEAGKEGAERLLLMGRLESIRSFIGNLLNSTTVDELVERMRGSNRDITILTTIHPIDQGIKSGELAVKTGIPQNSLTNCLPALEKLGLITRSRMGKNSFIYPTTKGKALAEKLKKTVPDEHDVAKTEETTSCWNKTLWGLGSRETYRPDVVSS